MMSAIGVGVLLTVVGSTLTYANVEMDGRLETHGIDYTDVSKVSRSRRSALIFSIERAIEGIKAATKLLKGTFQVFPSEAGTSKYLKPGNYETAVSDFQSVNPIHVHDFDLPGKVKGKAGVVGDRIIRLEHRKVSGKITLKITKGMGTKYERTQKIDYLNLVSRSKPPQ